MELSDKVTHITARKQWLTGGLPSAVLTAEYDNVAVGLLIAGRLGLRLSDEVEHRRFKFPNANLHTHSMDTGNIPCPLMAQDLYDTAIMVAEANSEVDHRLVLYVLPLAQTLTHTHPVF